MKMLVTEFLQAYDLHGAILEKAKKQNINLELTVALSAWRQPAFSTDASEKKALKLVFLNIFELQTEIPLGRIKGNPLKSITAEERVVPHEPTLQIVRVSVEAKDGDQTIQFQSRRMEVEEVSGK